MELLVNLLIGIAWPVAAVWIAYLFKGELRSLLYWMFKYKDLEAKFESGLAEAEAKVTAIERSSPSSPPRPEISSKLEQLCRITDVSPRAAIMEAWVLVEDAAGKSGFVQGATIPRVNLHFSLRNWFVLVYCLRVVTHCLTKCENYEIKLHTYLISALIKAKLTAIFNWPPECPSLFSMLSRASMLRVRIKAFSVCFIWILDF